MNTASWKPYRIPSGQEDGMKTAVAYGKVSLGETALFWRHGLHRYAIGLDQVRRIFRRVDHVYGKLCLGGSSYDVQYLVLILTDGTELQLHIGDRAKAEAERLMEDLKVRHPEISYGKA